MPQKGVVKGKKIEKKAAANKHGKGQVATKKGKLDVPPRKARLLQEYAQNQEVTKAVNAKNETTFAGKAEQAGGRLKALKGPPPVLAPKGKAKAAAAKAAAGPKADMEED